MRELRIVFMGTPDFAVKSLEAILKAKFHVVGVITAPDRPAGRGRKLSESAVKQFAVSQGLKVMQPTNLKSEEFQKELAELRPNVQVVVAFRMLPKSVWSLPEFGTFNLHASLLPEYRGAAPINWAVINGEKKTGVTTFFLDEKIDTGKIIFQEKEKITEKDTAGSLHDRLMETGADLVVKTLKAIKKEKIRPIAQDESKELKEAPKLDRENTKVNWFDDLQDIHNLIRGLTPYPTAWSYLENAGEKLSVKIYDVTKAEQDHHFAYGDIVVNGGELRVAVPNGFIIIKEMQLPGKKRMAVKDLLNGYEFATDAKML